MTAPKQLEAQLLRTQRLESIGTLAAGIAHDFNNLLTPILMASKLLGGTGPKPERLSLLAAIQSGAERGAELVGQLLAFTSGIEVRSPSWTPAAIVEETVALLGHTLPEDHPHPHRRPRRPPAGLCRRHPGLPGADEPVRQRSRRHAGRRAP